MLFRHQLERAPGHAHLYAEFEAVLARIAAFRAEAPALDADLAANMLMTVDALLKENEVGRRPWTGEWETYFAKCLENAARLLKAFSAFEGSRGFCPSGYCNRFLDAFVHMDRLERECAERQPRWSRHFSHLAAMAAELFALVADKDARVDEQLLEHPDDAVFTWLLTGYAQSGTSQARVVLQGYLDDEEPWVRRLAGQLSGT